MSIRASCRRNAQGPHTERTNLELLARRHTKLLVVYFALAVVMLIAAVYAVFILAFSRHDLFNPELLGWVALFQRVLSEHLST